MAVTEIAIAALENQYSNTTVPTPQSSTLKYQEEDVCTCGDGVAEAYNIKNMLSPTTTSADDTTMFNVISKNSNVETSSETLVGSSRSMPAPSDDATSTQAEPEYEYYTHALHEEGFAVWTSYMEQDKAWEHVLTGVGSQFENRLEEYDVTVSNTFTPFSPVAEY